MEEKRLAELLTYAKVCFEHLTSPFELIHLRKKKVTDTEVVELSKHIAKTIEDELDWSIGAKNLAEYVEQAEHEFKETQ